MRLQMPRFRFKDPNSTDKKRKNKKDFKKIQEKRKKVKVTDDDEIEQLRKQLWPDFGDKVEEKQTSDIKMFTDVPISKKTLKGLSAMKFSKPTDIQRESLLYALKGHDILGAAKTGSGKTLAFLIPIIETLFRQRYTPSFGMAALVISPTRELAYQSYDVLRKIGRFHSLSFGLAIGGMFLREEAKKMNTTNVVICTPGRLLQHFEQTPNFTADELKVLVLDEADKILDMGFAETMNSIVEALPRQRQTLLFSATQTKSVKSLARLSLKRPIYVSVHEKAKEVTPTTLNQRYIVCDMHEKVNLLWSFVKSHRQKKMLVFLSSCKEVRYLYQVFKKMHPGLTILCLHGHMKQLQRMEAYENFSRKKNVVMLATDVAARGLDFPVVHWVVQVDKPENVDTYIHRVGRTARYDQVGEALLMLTPSEEVKMVEDLQKRKIPVVKLKVSKKRMFDVTKKLENFCAADQELKNNAQKGFISVMKTLYVLDRATFHQVDTDAYAASLGLVQAPRLPFVNKTGTKGKKSNIDGSDDENGSDDEEDGSEEESILRKNIQKGKGKTLDFRISDEDDDDDNGADNNIYNVVKASTSHLNDEEVEASKEELNLVEEGRNAGKKKLTFKKKMKMLKESKLITFDDEGNPEGQEKDDDDDDDGEQGLNIDKAVQRLRKQDKIDKEVQRQRIKQEHREKRLKEKQKRREETMARMGIVQEDEGGVVLGGPDHDDEDDGPQAKRRRMATREKSDDNSDDNEDDVENDEEEEDDDSDNEGEMGVDDDDDDDDDDDNDDNDDDDDNEEEDEDDIETDDEEINTGDVSKDEAAVLALLGGGR